jgi:16S rRNA (guanine527-N7)-methyltransferase
MELIKKYFPEINELQLKQFEALESLYIHWNQQINVISRKDTENFYERHVLHSLGIAKTIRFQKGTNILDIGTGGGFPGIPMAIMFPDCDFTLIDSIGKKIKVVNEISHSLGLQNVTAIHGRADTLKTTYDFIISRAVTNIPAFLPWTRNKFRKHNANSLKNGILYLKGENVVDELTELKIDFKIFPLQSYFEEEFFDTKVVLYIKV